MSMLIMADAWGMHGGWGWWIVMMLGMVVFWGLVIFGVVWLVRGSSTGWWSERHGPEPRETARDVLDRRYAKGEISEEEYRQRREVLGDGPRQGTSNRAGSQT